MLLEWALWDQILTSFYKRPIHNGRPDHGEGEKKRKSGHLLLVSMKSDSWGGLKIPNFSDALYGWPISQDQETGLTYPISIPPFLLKIIF